MRYSGESICVEYMLPKESMGPMLNVRAANIVTSAFAAPGSAAGRIRRCRQKRKGPAWQHTIEGGAK